jgi:hypothetical protein
MSSVNYSLKHKGVKLIPPEKAWVKSKNGKQKLNPKYQFVGKIDTKMPNLIISASEKGKPKYKGNTHDLCAPAKKQIVEHFFDSDGKRNRKSVAYFGIEKKK